MKLVLSITEMRRAEAIGVIYRRHRHRTDTQDSTLCGNILVGIATQQWLHCGGPAFLEMFL